MAEPLWDPLEIRNALGLPADTRGEFSPIKGVSIDSRTVAPGDLFVAIKGDRTDGHNYVAAALQKGAAAAIVSLDFVADPSSSPEYILRVNDTLEALNALARASRERSKANIVAVTGSVGKTGTKEMLRTMFGAIASVHASEKSYNNQWGVPLSLARMPGASRFGVFEIGMNHAGEITPLAEMVRPHVAIVTWIAPVHIEFFASVADIADAKAEIFTAIEPSGTAVLPADNDHFERLAEHARQKSIPVVGFGEHEGAQAKLLTCEPCESGSRVTANILGEDIAFVLSAPGRHLAVNAVGALAAAKLLGGDLRTMAEALAHFRTPEGRGRQQRFETPDGPVLVIDETYNANPASMRAALQVLGSMTGSGIKRRIAVLGDMLELGHGGAQFHADLATAINSGGIDLVFCTGSLMAYLYERLPQQKRGGFAETAEALTPSVLDAVQGGDAVTVKGSLGSKMGPLAEALRSYLAELTQNGQGRNAA